MTKFEIQWIFRGKALILFTLVRLIPFTVEIVRRASIVTRQHMNECVRMRIHTYACLGWLPRVYSPVSPSCSTTRRDDDETAAGDRSFGPLGVIASGRSESPWPGSSAPVEVEPPTDGYPRGRRSHRAGGGVVVVDQVNGDSRGYPIESLSPLVLHRLSYRYLVALFFFLLSF